MRRWRRAGAGRAWPFPSYKRRVSSLNLVTYERIGLANPVSEAAIGELLALTDLKAGDRAAELGCGGAALAILLAGHGLDVLAVDRGEAMAELARRKVAAAGMASRIEVRAGEANAVAAGCGPFRLVTAMGTTGLGDFRMLSGLTAPGGWILWGDIVWAETPAVMPPGVAMDYDTDAGWRARAAAAGLELIGFRASDDADWDAYVDRLQGAVRAWRAEAPDDPAGEAVEAHMRATAALYSPDYRRSLGFATYLFRKPG